MNVAPNCRAYHYFVAAVDVQTDIYQYEEYSAPFNTMLPNVIPYNEDGEVFVDNDPEQIYKPKITEAIESNSTEENDLSVVRGPIEDNLIYNKEKLADLVTGNGDFKEILEYADV